MTQTLTFFAAMLGMVVVILAETAIITWAIIKIVNYTGDRNDG